MANHAGLEKRWKKIQSRLGFSDEELQLFKSNPKYRRCIEDAPLFSTQIIVVDVLEARGCTARYKKGDKFQIDGQGCLIVEKSPAKLCVSAIYSIKTLVDRMWEAFYHNTTEVFHDTIRCPDVGIQRGGAGEVTLRITSLDKKSVI